ncbi:MAG: hypothetical protein JNM27_02165 [Leptospirales bacterium]|nr:hypothetical protein [Leptospirales bacterium]
MSRILLLLTLFVMNSCRGREYLEEQPAFRNYSGTGILAFSSGREGVHGRRMILVDPESGAAYDLDPALKKDSIAGGVSFGAFRFLSSGEWAIVEKESPRRPLEPGLYLKASGTYQKETRLILTSQPGSPAEERILFEAGPDERIGAVAGNGHGLGAFCLIKNQNISFYTIGRNGPPVRVGELSGYYVFDLAISRTGTVAARISPIERQDEKLSPADIWISEAFGPASSPGILLKLRALDSPGFLTGRGFEGVKDLAFSPDGQTLAVLLSQEDDCRMVDEGGNLGCRKNIRLIYSKSPNGRQLTKLRTTQADRLDWIDLSDR